MLWQRRFCFSWEYAGNQREVCVLKRDYQDVIYVVLKRQLDKLAVFNFAFSEVYSAVVWSGQIIEVLFKEGCLVL